MNLGEWKTLYYFDVQQYRQVLEQSGMYNRKWKLSEWERESCTRGDQQHWYKKIFVVVLYTVVSIYSCYHL